MAYTATPIHGKTARAEKNNTAIDFTTGFSLDFSLDMADASRQGQSWKEAIPGMAGATGSLEIITVLGDVGQKALVDNIIAATPGTLLTDIKFLLNGSTEGFSGNFYVTGFSVSTTIGDVIKSTVPVQLNGAPSLSDGQ